MNIAHAEARQVHRGALGAVVVGVGVTAAWFLLVSPEAPAALVACLGSLVLHGLARGLLFRRSQQKLNEARRRYGLGDFR